MNQKLNSRAEEMDVSLRVFTFRENIMFLEGFYFPTLSRFYSPLGLLSLHVYTATFRVAAIHVYKIGLPFKLVLA